MPDLVASIVNGIILPGMVAAIGLAIAKRRCWMGGLTDATLGGIGGLAAGLVALGLLRKFGLSTWAVDVWPPALAAIVGSLGLITSLRATADILIEATARD